MRTYYVYIMASRSLVLYVGVTSDLARRVTEHRSHEIPGFTSRYNVDRLVYFETFTDVTAAIAREKELKRMSREQKFELIRGMNWDLRDLAGKVIPQLRRRGQ
jgi:putative endonuclease